MTFFSGAHGPEAEGRRTLSAIAAAARESAFFALFACIASWSDLSLDGIAANDEGARSIEKLEIFRLAYATGDLFPLWTPYSAAGHGSGLCLFYHRLYDAIFGALALVCGSLVALKLSVPVLLTVGACGMRRLALALGAPRFASVVAGVALIFCSYGCLEWLYRGAMAELTAMMVLPWFFAACAQARSRGRGVWRLAPSMALLFYAHTVLFYWALPFVAALAIDLGVAPRPKSRRCLPRLAADLALLGVLLCAVVGPYALAIFGAAPSFPLGAIRGIFQVFPLEWYFIDDGVPWFSTRIPWGFSPEIGRWLVVGILASGGVGLAAGSRRSVEARWLVCPAAAYLGLQSMSAVGIYSVIPGGTMLQFPFRLIAFMTIVAIAVFARLLAVPSGASAARRCQVVIAVTCLAGQALHTIAFQGATREPSMRLPSLDLAERLAHPTDMLAPREYMPRGAELLPPEAFLRASPGCSLSNAADPSDDLARTRHFRSLRIAATAPSECRVSFSQYDSPIVAVEAKGGVVERRADGTTEVTFREGEHSLVVRQRSLFELAAAGAGRLVAAVRSGRAPL